MSTSYNYQSKNCSIPLIVPKDSVVFARQSLFNLLKVLGSVLAESNGLVCLYDIRSAISFASRIAPLGYDDRELHDAQVFIYDDNDEQESSDGC